MDSTEGDIFSHDGYFNVTELINSINAGICEYNIITKDVKWSSGFYAVLGYDAGDIPTSYDFFFENLLYYEDKPAFVRSFNRHQGVAETVFVRLLTKRNGYRWFESTVKRWGDKNEPKITGSIVDVHDFKILQ